VTRAALRSIALRVAAASSYVLALACDPVVTSIGAWEPRVVTDAASEPARAQYVEAEHGELSGGFTIDDDASASSGQAIAPPMGAASEDAPGAARARYTLELPDDGEYLFWGRIHAPDADRNRFWFQVDGGDWTKWRISVGEIWYWDDFHADREYGSPRVFALERGAHELVIASCSEGVRLDRLYVTAEGDEPPGNDTPCDPPHSIEIGGECLPSCGLLEGTACGPLACAGRTPLPAYDCDVCCRVDP
jgi:hypothetical protein